MLILILIMIGYAQDSTLVLIEESSILIVDSADPEIQLNNPNGSEEYDSASMAEVEWSATDDSFGNTPITISISTTLGGFSDELIANTENDGSEMVNLPNENTAFSRMTVEVVDEFGNTSYDMSDGYFTIGNPDEFTPGDSTLVINENTNAITVDSADPMVELINPNGGEEYDSGSMAEVEWSATDDSFGDAPVTVSLSTSLGGFSNTLIESTENDGSEMVNLPSENTAFSRMTVEVVDEFGNTTSDMSDGYFTIGNPDEFIPGDSTLVINENTGAITVDSADPVVELFSPNGGEEYWCWDELISTWQATDNSFGNQPIDVYMSYDIGGDYADFIIATENDGSASNTVVSTGTDYARIKVVATDEFGNSTNDESDDYFWINPIADINMDGYLNVQDILGVINLILGDGGTPEQIEEADLNEDDILNILDLLLMINIILV